MARSKGQKSKRNAKARSRSNFSPSPAPPRSPTPVASPLSPFSLRTSASEVGENEDDGELPSFIVAESSTLAGSRSPQHWAALHPEHFPRFGLHTGQIILLRSTITTHDGKNRNDPFIPCVLRGSVGVARRTICLSTTVRVSASVAIGMPVECNFDSSTTAEELATQVTFTADSISAPSLPQRLRPSWWMAVANSPAQLETFAELVRSEARSTPLVVGSVVMLTYGGGLRRLRVVECACASNMAANMRFFWIDARTRIHFKWEGNKDNSAAYSPTACTAQPVVAAVPLGGLENERQLLEQHIDLALSAPHRALLAQARLPSPVGVLLEGPPGCGKTLLVQHVAARRRCGLVVVNGAEPSTKVVGRYFGDSEEKLREHFDSAKRLAPCLLFIDEIDALLAGENGEIANENGDSGRRILATLLSLMDGLSDSSRRTEGGGMASCGGAAVMVIAATNRIESIDGALRRPGRFDCEIEIAPPSVADRFSILRVMLDDDISTVSDDELHSISSITHGFVGADLAALVAEAGLERDRMENPFPHTRGETGEEHGGKECDSRNNNSGSDDCDEAQLHDHRIRIEHLKASLPRIRPSAMREAAVEVPHVRWSDIGGGDEVKQQLREAVEWPLSHPEAFERMGIRPPRGILLYGPPGCSKTMMAKALASESGMNFIAVKGPELFSKWVGESERAVRAVYRRARAVAPSVVFFDEIDAMATARGDEGGGGVGDRVLSQLLHEMDGISSLRNVTTVAATNRPDVLDAALLRPGRLDRLVYVGPPDTEAREQILANCLRDVPLEEELNFRKLAEETAGFSGAEVTALCREASLRAIERYTRSTEHGDSAVQQVEGLCISLNDINAARISITPQITREMVMFYEKFEKSKM